MTIRLLPPDVAAKIAAGEVVERPASVVKELVENAIDAGASIIGIELAEGGKRLIRVSDDGHGIPAAEAEYAFLRHATSKLSTVEDLSHIMTLGFRGEALASIAAVSLVTMVTRSRDEPAGTRLYLEAGELVSREVTGAPVGTVITVENLFFNVPARLKFMKAESTERQLIGALISRYALAYPGVRFTLMHGRQELLRTTGSGDLRQVMAEVYGADVAAQMLEIVQPEGERLRADLPYVRVSGLVGQPALSRSNRSHITVFVNGRWVQDSSLTYAITQAYHTMMPAGRFPVAVIMIEVPPEDLDVNIHPTKTQVRFRRADAVFSTVQRVVRRTLIEGAEMPAAHDDILWGAPDWQARRERLAEVTRARMSQLGIGMDVEDEGQFTRHEGRASAGQPASSEPARRRSSLPFMRVVGQVGATYIVTEGPRGLYLIDQHAAHHRILYEQLMAQRAAADIPAQELLEPIAVEVSAEEMAAVEANLAGLHEMGFVVEVFGRSTLRLRAVPAILASSDPVEALLAALGRFEGEEMPGDVSEEERIAARISQQAAIKAGQTLSQAEMQALIRQLEQCEMPQISPQGQPTMIHISAEQLAREFGRLGAS
ncbi:MAG: DNA mismatch repair endonuclease MutL [Anaerolineae bacterium]